VKPRRGPIEERTASGRALKTSEISESRADKGIATDLDRMREKVTAAAFKILAARPQSERQLRDRLLAKPWVEPEAVDQCIARLKELGYVNDAVFARNYASSRVGLKAVGRARVARELAGKKVSQDAIEEAVGSVFNEAGEETLIDRAIEKRIRTHGRPSDRGSVKRMFDHLARLGFEYSLIVRKLQALKANIGDDDQ
jgi:regulatory protein